jgi:hypothetical protein
VKRLEYTPDKKAVLQLLTAEIPCCVEEGCIWRVEGIPLCDPEESLVYSLNFDVSAMNAELSAAGAQFANNQINFSGSVGFVNAGNTVAAYIAAADALINDGTYPNVRVDFRADGFDAYAVNCYNAGLNEIVLIIRDSFNPLANKWSDFFTITLGQYASVETVLQDDVNGFSTTYTFNNLYSLQVFRGTWQTVTPTDGAYQSNQEFTAWRIIDSEGNVIEQGEPEIICT